MTGFGVRQSVSPAAIGAETDPGQLNEKLSRQDGVTLSQWLNAMLAEHTPGLIDPAEVNLSESRPDEADQLRLDPAHALRSVAQHLESLETNRTGSVLRNGASSGRSNSSAPRNATKVAARLDALLDEQVALHARRREFQPPPSLPPISDLPSFAPSSLSSSVESEAGLGDIRDQIASLASRVETWRGPGRPAPASMPDSLAEIRAQIAELSTRLETLAPAHLINDMMERIVDLGRRVDEHHRADVAHKPILSLQGILKDLLHRFVETRQSVAGLEANFGALSDKLGHLCEKGASAAGVAELQQHVRRLYEWAGAALPAGALAALSEKIAAIDEQIAALPDRDAFEEAVGQINADMVELRRGFAKGTANLGGLVQRQTTALGGRIDTVTKGVNAVEKSVGSFAATLRSMGERLESLQSATKLNGQDVLEEHLARISRRLDAAHATTPDLALIDRKMGDLMAHLHDTRQAAIDAADEAAARVARAIAEQWPAGAEASDLKRSLDNLQLAQENTDRRLHYVLEAVEIALARLPGNQDDEFDKEWVKPNSEPFADASPQPAPARPEAAKISQPVRLAATGGQSSSSEIKGSSSFDQGEEELIEPGSMPPLVRPTSLEQSRPMSESPRVSFIAAARRAARTEAETHPKPADEADAKRPRLSEMPAVQRRRNGGWLRWAGD